MPKTGQPADANSVFTRFIQSSAKKFETLAARPFVQLLLFALFMLAVVGVMILGMGAEGRSHEVTPGEVASRDVKATRDFVFLESDRQAWEKERDAAARSVSHVYDWQEGLGEDLRQRITRANANVRTALTNTIRTSLSNEDPRRLTKLEESTAPGQLDQALLDLIARQERVALARELRSEHFDAILGVILRESDFDTFARAGFPSHVESALGAVVGDVMTRIIVPSKRILESGDEAGVFLRRLRNDRLLIEYRIANVDAQVVPLERVPSLVEEVGAERLVSVGDRELRSAIVSAATALIQPNTTFNESETNRKREEARNSVADTVLREEFRKGQIIVDRGHLVTDRHEHILQQMQAERETLGRPQVIAGVVIFALLLLVTLYLFGRRNIRKFGRRPRDLIFMASSMLIVLLVTRIGILLARVVQEQISVVPVDAWFYLIPVAAAAMLVRLVLNSESAMVVAVLFAALVGLMADNSLFFMCYAAVGGVVGAGSVRTVKNRMGLFLSGLNVAVANAVAVIAFLLIDGRLLGADAVDSSVQAASYIGLALAGGILAGFLVSVLLPLFEALFGYTTDIKLLELSNLNHPALRELILRAPGSYHHSMMVGSLCEAAAESIGCNPLLSRVGAYYHDIGKAKNPQYFAENQKLGQNPHDKLKPNISALVIKAHVKDGIEMAKAYRLPVVIQDFIAQHHGTSLIRYFFHKAKQLEDPDIPEVVEADYRYPGPKPQTRETAICLLADGIEAASRAMPDPSPARLRGLVQKMINLAFTDGQLDECELTLKDLNQIADAFHRILTGIYHHRPEYPGPEKKRGEKKSDGKASEKKTEKKSEKKTEKKERKSDDRNSTEVKRKARRTDNYPAPVATPVTTPIVEEDRAAVVAALDESSEWELTQEQRDDIEGDLHGGRHQRGKDGEDAPSEQESDDEDSDEGRKSLPRLGSH